MNSTGDADRDVGGAPGAGRDDGTDHSPLDGITDFLGLAGREDPESVFTCSSRVHGVTGTLLVLPDALVLSEDDGTVRIPAAEVDAWWDSTSGDAFSLAVQGRHRHSVVLLSEFRSATVHAMTQAYGPLNRLSA
ncbi:hypothetical protein [Rathayibacter sp. SD072]|uniref:hypothetical protein n=1 Tax=Rathayibacter sp. SD072 TaxID=2781731 RepID=UPI001A97CDC1|nr:hypothetical protein [Rathayibacter sp. SD072]MBO0985286.1 hypothetical protein [Rathayibacter sp. SD072]